MAKKTAATRYRNLQLSRSLYLRRAIDGSKLTIPSLIPESDNNTNPTGDQFNKLHTCHQGVGSRGVSSLAAKLLLALYPPSGDPFFRLMIDGAALRQQAANTGQDEGEIVSQVEVALANMEREIIAKLDELQARSSLFEAMKHLIVGGNALLYVEPDAIRMYSLRSYVCHRDPEGHVREIVVREQVTADHLPEGHAAIKDEDPNANHDLYTYVQIDYDKDRVEWYQEFDGEKINSTAGFTTVDRNPWICLRWSKISGESYGRSLVEEILPDLQALDSLTQALTEGSLIAAKCLFLVNPNGVTRADVLANSSNGAIVGGNADDVQPLQVGKQGDFGTALQAMQVIEKRLAYSFLLNESVRRDAERVSAEEIRVMAGQLEEGLGGTYSQLSQELQLPLVKRVISLMEVEGAMPPLPKGLIKPQVTTGLEAIGRNNEKARLTNFLQIIGATLGPEALLNYINPTELIKRFAAADSIETSGLVKTEEELSAEQSQQEELALQQQLTANAIQSGATNPPPPEVPTTAGA